VVLVRSEHGYVGMRLLAALGLVSLLVWLVPMALLSRKQAELVTSVPSTGAGSLGSASAGGSGQGGPVAQASDVQAQALIHEAISVAQVWFAEHGTYAGFGPEQAGEYDPAVTFTAGPAATGIVAMRVTPDAVVVVTLSGGGPLCAAVDGDAVSFGRADATSPQECQGGWG
jgi:hypothetical protein